MFAVHCLGVSWNHSARIRTSAWQVATNLSAPQNRFFHCMIGAGCYQCDEWLLGCLRLCRLLHCCMLMPQLMLAGTAALACPYHEHGAECCLLQERTPWSCCPPSSQQRCKEWSGFRCECTPPSALWHILAALSAASALAPIKFQRTAIKVPACASLIHKLSLQTRCRTGAHATKFSLGCCSAAGDAQAADAVGCIQPWSWGVLKACLAPLSQSHMEPAADLGLAAAAMRGHLWGTLQLLQLIAAPLHAEESVTYEHRCLCCSAALAGSSIFQLLQPTAGPSMLQPFVADFRARFIALLTGAFRAFKPALALSILSPQLTFSEAETQSSIKAGLPVAKADGEPFSAYDLKRLQVGCHAAGCWSCVHRGWQHMASHSQSESEEV